MNVFIFNGLPELKSVVSSDEFRQLIGDTRIMLMFAVN